MIQIRGLLVTVLIDLNSIGAAGFDYDFGALENSDSKLNKSYANIACGFLLSRARVVVTADFYRFDIFSEPSKARLFMADALRFAPKGVLAWLMDGDRVPAIARLRENKACVHEVAAQIVEDKRQELKLKSGVPQKDILTLLGLS
jgi:hypothetical protein